LQVMCESERRMPGELFHSTSDSMLRRMLDSR
jgi:hypothetical protein